MVGALKANRHPVIAKENEKFKEGRDWSVLRQHLAALTVNLAAISGGACLGWTAPALPLLQREDTDVELPLFVTIDEGSWISCLLPLGAAVGSIPAGKMADWIGRKKAILSLTIPFIVGWLFILFADTSITLVYIGRFIGGIGVGGTTVLVSLYNDEIAEDSIRGALGVYLDLNIVNGILLVNIFGVFMSYTWFTISCCIIPVIFFATFIFMPESPIYLLLQDRTEEATKSLLWLRKGKTCYDVDDEINYLKENLRLQMAEKDNRPLFERLKEFSLKSVTTKTVAIVLGLMFFQKGSGMNAVAFYTVSIFNRAGTNISSNVCSVLVNGAQALFELFSSIFVDRLGRRPLLLFSALVSACCHAILTVYFYFLDSGNDMTTWNWVPITVLMIFFIGYALGLSPLPWSMMAELVPTKHQNWMGPLASCFNWVGVILITKEFPDMLLHLGTDVTFGIFSCLCFLASVFVWFCIPETKGKSREEIQELLSGKKNTSVDII